MRYHLTDLEIKLAYAGCHTKIDNTHFYSNDFPESFLQHESDMKEVKVEVRFLLFCLGLFEFRLGDFLLLTAQGVSKKTIKKFTRQ